MTGLPDYIDSSAVKSPSVRGLSLKHTHDVFLLSR